jgi:cell division protein FtsQ
MADRRSRAQGRPPPRAGAAAVAAPRGAARAGELRRFAPSRRSLVVGCGLVAIAVAGYYAARESSAFAVRHLEVRGAPPEVRAHVRRAAGPFLGVSLLALDGAALERRLESLPTVVSASYDRAFPHTLRLRIVPETPVAVLRRGPELWLVSARGRVIARVRKGSNGALARIWVKRAVPVTAGGFLAPNTGGVSARALALANRFPARIEAVSLAHGALLFRLRSGLELRLGEPTDVRLKLAIARRALRQLPAGSSYLDVSVPGRPVAGLDPQVSGGG